MKHDCNNCENTSCKGDIIRTMDGSIKIKCRGWRKPEPMKTPLLMVVLEHKGAGTVINKLFKDFDIQFSETDRYPFFRLAI